LRIVLVKVADGVSMMEERESRRRPSITTILLVIVFVGVVSAFLINKIQLLYTAPPSQGIDYSQFPIYEVPLRYILNYALSAWSSLLFAFFIGGLIQEYMHKDLIVKYLGSKRASSYLIAAVLSPLFVTCSCSVIPIYVSLLMTGASLGVAMTFFLMAPAANLITILLTGEYLGWDLGGLRLVFSIMAAITCGVVFDRTKLARELTKQYDEIRVGRAKKLELKKTTDDRVRNVYNNIWFLMKSILGYLLIGLVVVSYIAAYFPNELIESVFTGWWGILAGSLLGGPLYTPALVEIVLTSTLLAKGMSRATALAFMMGQPYDFVSMPPNSRYFRWTGVLMYAAIFFLFSLISGVAYVALFGWI